MNCPKCQQVVAGNPAFCMHCGYGLGSIPGSTSAAAPAAAVAGGTATFSFASVSAARMSGLIGRVIDIVLRPRATWPQIAVEPTSFAQLFVGYVMPLAAIQALVSFVRMSLIGIHLPFGTTLRTPIVQGLTSAVVGFGLALVGVVVLAVIVNALAPTFKGTRSLRQALNIAAYAVTPAWLGAVAGLLPALGTVVGLVCGLYAIYLMYLGLPVLMRAPPDKALGYTATVVICSIVLGIVIGALAAAFGGLGHFGYGSYTQRQADAQQQGATAVGNMIGSVLGTDQQGKSALGAAVNNLSQAGRQIEQRDQARANANGGTHANGVPDAEDTQQAINAAGGLLSALGGSLGGSHRVAPVDFHTLEPLLPASVSGMQRGTPEGSSKEAMGVHVTAASVDFTGTNNARIKVSISDVSGVSGLLGLAGNLAHTDQSESANGYEKDVTVKGRSVHEKYDSAGRQGELSVIVAKRFEVDVEGSNVDMGALQGALAQVDLGRLESMKDANPQSR
jgi:hypothetical protein